MEDFAEAHQETLGKVLDFSNGVPSHDTIGRVLSIPGLTHHSDLRHKF
jgi:hypothetical protein